MRVLLGPSSVGKGFRRCYRRTSWHTKHQLPRSYLVSYCNICRARGPVLVSHTGRAMSSRSKSLHSRGARRDMRKTFATFGTARHKPPPCTLSGVRGSGPFHCHAVTLQNICSELLLGYKSTVGPSHNYSSSALLTIQVYLAKHKPCLSTQLFWCLFSHL